MSRGPHHVAHLVAESVDDARSQWVEVFNRDRTDLGPGQVAGRAVDDITGWPERTPELAPDAQHIVCLRRQQGLCRAAGVSYARGRSTPADTASPYPTTSSPRWPGIGR